MKNLAWMVLGSVVLGVALLTIGYYPFGSAYDSSAGLVAVGGILLAAGVAGGLLLVSATGNRRDEPGGRISL